MTGAAGRTRLVGAILSLLAVTLSLGGCQTTSRTVVLGLIAMLEGQNAANGRSMLDAASLAVAEVNNRGGLRLGNARARVSLIVEKDPDNPEGALDAARLLVTTKGATALIGPQFSGNAIPVARFAESTSTIMIAPMSTNPETTAGKSYVFRIPYLDTFQGFVLARLAREDLHAARGAVLFDVAGDYNRTLAEQFRLDFERSGGSIVAWETYTSDRNRDFGAQLRRIRDARAEVLLLPNYTVDVREQVIQARRIGVSAIFLGGDGWSPDLAMEAAATGSYATGQWHPSIARGPAGHFVGDFRSTFRRLPDDVAASTYDACRILFAAMETAKSASPAAVRRALRSMAPFDGVTGRISYANGGDPGKSAVIIHFAGGRVEVHAVVEP